MSFNLSWIASADIQLPDLERRMGLKRTGRTCEELEAEYASVNLGNWSLVMANQVDYLESLELSSVSKGGSIITLALHGGIMISVAECWTDRRRKWHVMHNGQTQRVDHLAVDGDLPAEFTEAKAHCERSIRDYVPPPAPPNVPELPAAERAIFERMGATVMPWGAPQQKVDFHFDIPIDLADRLVGFRHGRRRFYFELEPETTPTKR